MNFIIEQTINLSLLITMSMGILEIYAHALTHLEKEKESYKVVTQNLLEVSKKRSTYSYKKISFLSHNKFCKNLKCNFEKIKYSSKNIQVNQRTYIKPQTLYDKK